jgi:hypothetical protein
MAEAQVIRQEQVIIRLSYGYELYLTPKRFEELRQLLLAEAPQFANGRG